MQPTYHNNIDNKNQECYSNNNFKTIKTNYKDKLKDNNKDKNKM